MFSNRSDDKVVVFIDGENIHYSAGKAGRRMDYKKLINSILGGRNLRKVAFYTVGSNTDGKVRFIDFLRLNGFRTVVEDDNSRGRAMLHAKLMVDALELVGADTFILCSGDSTFSPLLAALDRKGIRTEVCNLKECTSSELISTADVFHDLTTILDECSLPIEVESKEGYSKLYQ